MNEYNPTRGAPPATDEPAGLLWQLFVVDGPGGFKRVDGQFAVAIWDSLERRLYLARDFLGVVPLFYTAHAQGLAFASEIRGLITLAAVGRSYDLTGLSNYLTYLTVPGPGTLIKGGCKLPAGHVAELDAAGKLTLHRFWDLADHAIAERDDANYYI